MQRYLIYDTEIIKAIQGKNEPRLEGIEYCAGWQDHANMGVSVIGAYDSVTGYRVFLEDNFGEFEALLENIDLVVHFNGLGFDNKVLATELDQAPILLATPQYDILVELWRGVGLGPTFQYPTHTGFGLDAVCAANFGTRKTGTGGKAPIDWQQGRRGSVIDYCLSDVKLTKQCFDRILNSGGLRDPRDSTRWVSMRAPWQDTD